MKEFRDIKQTFVDGFTTDYYSTHRLERYKNFHLKKYSCSKTDIEESPNLQSDDKENLKHYKRILCIPIGYEFNYINILVNLKKKSSQYESPNIEQMKNVTIMRVTKTNSEKYIILFDYGVVVFWSFSEEEEKELIQIIAKNCKYLINGKEYNSRDVLPQHEENTFYYRKGETFNISQRNKITVESNSKSEILSIVYGLAQHTILSHYESDVAVTIEETKSIPIEMRDKGRISLSKKEISRNIGLIFMRRSAVNLNSDILDTPDIFWEQKNESESFYSTTRKFLEIDKRVSVLDKRMKILKELYDVMNNEIKTQGKFRLEWIVVYLIVIEIFVSLFWKMLIKDILKLY